MIKTKNIDNNERLINQNDKEIINGDENNDSEKDNFLMKKVSVI